VQTIKTEAPCILRPFLLLATIIGILPNYFKTSSIKKRISRKDRKIVGILFDTIVLSAQNALPDIVDIWNETYPEDPMEEVLPAFISMAAPSLFKDQNFREQKDIQKISMI
jgi:hypothetical protein